MFKLVLIGGPIWYWHPNALTTSFIKSSDLHGKDVVLFGGNKAIAMMIGGASMLLAAIFLKRVYEPSVAELKAGRTIKEPQTAST